MTDTFTWMFGHMLLKSPPVVFKYLAVSMRAAVTCTETRTVNATRNKEMSLACSILDPSEEPYTMHAKVARKSSLNPLL